MVLVLAPCGLVAQRPSAPFNLLANACSSRHTSQRPTAETIVLNPCSFHGLLHHTGIGAEEFGTGIVKVPRAVIRPSNLKWELPIVAATGVLIAEGDQPLANRIQGSSIQHIARFWSNFGLGVEIASGGLAYVGGCAEHRGYLRDTGLTILDALAAAGVADLTLKLTFDRQFPYTPGSTGDFWGGGRSFPSGHAAVSFAFSSAIAHRYPKKRWLKWAAYGLATGVALSRYPAKRHYASDILVGSTLGYVIGSYMSAH
jgi:membrane-associated phospholipid phosphatase